MFKIPNTFPFLFSNKCWLSEMLLNKANREDPDQTAGQADTV